jgi:ParB family chromosome partitioning protein
MRTIVSNAAKAVTKQIGMLKKTISRLRAGDRLHAAFLVKHIPVKDISVRSNIRKAYTGIDELAPSIRRYGLLQPITVYREKNRYIVKTGHRRFLAYQTLCKEEPEKFHRIRCMVSAPENMDIIQLAENVQREDLSQTDLFNALLAMRDRGMTLRQIADAMGKTEGYIKNLFAGVNEITGNGELMALIDGHAGVTIQDIAETKGFADERERRSLLEQRKSGVINRAGTWKNSESSILKATVSFSRSQKSKRPSLTPLE